LGANFHGLIITWNKEIKKNRPPWMAVENLLATLLLAVLAFSKMGQIPHKESVAENKKGGPTQSRPNLTNHHYKEPQHATLQPLTNKWGIHPKLQFTGRL
jgi:hypothetical protein